MLVSDIYQKIKGLKEDDSIMDWKTNSDEPVCRMWIAMSEWTNSGDHALLTVSSTIELLAKWGCDVRLIVPYTEFVDKPIMKKLGRYR